MARIALPRITVQEPRRAHPFPFQIGWQTLEFLQGTLFYAAFADTAAGQQVRSTGGVEQIEKILEGRGLASTTIEQGWSILSKYNSVFEGSVFQAALIGMNSHWDWYVRKLTTFIRIARTHISLPALNKDQESKLAQTEFLAISDQLKILGDSTGIDILLSVDDVSDLKEMSLVRNIGLHNRWEVDDRYLRRTHTKGFSVGDLRPVNIEELERWRALLTKVINRMSVELAKVTCDVPDTEI